MKGLRNVRRWGERARLAPLGARKTSDRRWKSAKARSREAYSELNARLFTLEEQNLSPYECRVCKKGWRHRQIYLS